MALATQEKSDIVGKFARGENDTGSPEVQVALLRVVVGRLGVAAALAAGQQRHPPHNGRSVDLDVGMHRVVIHVASTIWLLVMVE